MVEIAASLYLLATAAFALVSLVVGTRLVLLSRRTARLPERLLGLSLIFTAGLGYGVMMVGILGNRASGADASHPLFTVITLVGWLFHNLGVVLMLRFVVVVFRPESRWARRLAWAMACVLWSGWAAYALAGGIGAEKPNAGFWVAFSVIGTYPLWTALEALAYWRDMRRRLALGLADPLVCNRFLLWSLAALCTAASIWLVNVPHWLGVTLGSVEGRAVTSLTMLGTAAFGIATVALYWLTFFPPAWYRLRIARGASREASR